MRIVPTDGPQSRPLLVGNPHDFPLYRMEALFILNGGTLSQMFQGVKVETHDGLCIDAPNNRIYLKNLVLKES
jgi:hypothetical protein